jgi:putative iron-only hydrogenase system regulator
MAAARRLREPGAESPAKLQMQGIHAIFTIVMQYPALHRREIAMDNRVAVISIIVEDRKQADVLNDILHEYSGYIIGRMGLPYSKKNLNIICIAIDAPLNTINALTGAIGRLPCVTAKVSYAKK